MILKFAGFRCSLVLSVVLVSNVSWGQGCTELPAERTVSDQKGGCLALLPVETPLATAKILMVMLHGDGEGQLGQRQLDRWAAIGRSLAAPDRKTTTHLRNSQNVGLSRHRRMVSELVMRMPSV